MTNSFSKLLSKFRRDEKGVTLVEYGIALVLAVSVGVGALSTLADDVDDEMTSASGVLQTTP
ncbi:Flp family type IVb pilin [Flavimaricola marinus]|uniref:Flp/Fap pilin component n=1 Tax=Flavimaricola marinus TaxID=1819565 RepID=A0A238L978_9RHOB|nr:Flp family type IVb pilin [Flavimaricola marinus]SMY06132.1 hypothetical protein LOM8899_00253 [Flavimaricola marinus]